MTLAVSDASLFLFSTFRPNEVIQVPWSEVKVVQFGLDQHFRVRTTADPEGKHLDLPLLFPGQGPSAQPLRDHFADSVFRVFEAAGGRRLDGPVGRTTAVMPRSGAEPTTDIEGS